MAPKNVFVLLGCCYPVFILAEQKLLSRPFSGKLTDVSSMSLKKRFCCFLAKLRCFSFSTLHGGFGLFAGNHDDRYFISLQKIFLLFCC